MLCEQQRCYDFSHVRPASLALKLLPSRNQPYGALSRWLPGANVDSTDKTPHKALKLV